ncbi:MAG TPA: peptidylprolyl isomerase [Oligoflexia bacterium]|nr:peptidylprolyl isomerase [Oligoflexia bacterium]
MLRTKRWRLSAAPRSRRHILFHFLFFILSQYLCAPLCSAAEQPESGEQIVAEVDGSRITKDELEQDLRRQLQNELQYFSETEHHFLRRRVLQRIIDRRLLLAEANANGYAPPDEEVMLHLRALKKSFVSEDVFRRELEQRGMDHETFASGIKDDLAVKNYVEKTIFHGLAVDAAEVRAEFDRDPQKYAPPEEVRARHILLRLNEDADPEVAAKVESKAKELARAAAEYDSDFIRLAREHSEAPNSAQGGDLGFFTQNQFESQFTQAAFALKPGQISVPVRTRHGFHIIKVEERRGGAGPEFDRVKAQVERELMERKQERALRDHLIALRRRHKVIVYYN